MSDRLYSWIGVLYWFGGILFLLVDLVRTVAVGHTPFAGGPFELPNGVVYLGLRAIADLMILSGLWLILSHMLSELFGEFNSHESAILGLRSKRASGRCGDRKQSNSWRIRPSAEQAVPNQQTKSSPRGELPRLPYQGEKQCPTHNRNAR
jgi:hypothetical protein